MEAIKDPTDPKNFKPKEIEVQMTAQEIALAAYVNCFGNLIDQTLAEGGHEEIISKISPQLLRKVMEQFALAKEPEDLYAILKEVGAISTCDKNKLKYLRPALRIGMKIANYVFKVKKADT